MSILDPDAPWVWLLYALAGAATTVIAVPIALRQPSQVERDVFRAHPGLLALLHLVLWVLWPLIAAGLAVSYLLVGAYRVLDWIADRRDDR